MSKKPKYKSRKEIIKTEKIRLLLVTIVFAAVCLFTGLASAFTMKSCSTEVSTNNTDTSGNGGNEDDTPSQVTDQENTLSISTVLNVEKSVNESVDVSPTVYLDNEPLTQTSLGENAKLEFELIGSLPDELIFSKVNGSITGTSTQIFHSQSFHILALYYKDKTKNSCLKVSTNEFTLQIYGIEFGNTIENIATLYDEEQISSSTPKILFKNQILSSLENIEYSLVQGSDTISGLSLVNGVVTGTPTTVTAEPAVFQIQASYQNFTVLSNEFKIKVSPNPKKDVHVEGINSIITQQDQGSTDYKWIEPQVVVSSGNASDYTVSYELVGDSLEGTGLTFNQSTGTITGKATGLINKGYTLVATISGAYTATISTNFLISITPFTFELNPIGSLETEVNGKSFDISFELKVNGVKIKEYGLEPKEGPAYFHLPLGVDYSSDTRKITGTPTSTFDEKEKEYLVTFVVTVDQLTPREITINLKVINVLTIDYKTNLSADNPANVVKNPSTNEQIISLRKSWIRFANPTINYVPEVKLNYSDAEKDDIHVLTYTVTPFSEQLASINENATDVAKIFVDKVFNFNSVNGVFSIDLGWDSISNEMLQELYSLTEFTVEVKYEILEDVTTAAVETYSAECKIKLIWMDDLSILWNIENSNSILNSVSINEISTLPTPQSNMAYKYQSDVDFITNRCYESNQIVWNMKNSLCFSNLLILSQNKWKKITDLENTQRVRIVNSSILNIEPENGWVSLKECDFLLFSSCLSSVVGQPLTFYLRYEQLVDAKEDIWVTISDVILLINVNYVTTAT